MTQQEKAKELVDKYESVFHFFQGAERKRPILKKSLQLNAGRN
jgi:hypothetical protein